MLTLRYANRRRGGRLAAWRLSIGSGVAKCKSRALFLAYGHRVAGAVLALALGARPGVAQAPLTPADSAILNSQPLKRLVLAASLFRRLSVLAAGLDREVVLCLQGSVSGI